MRADEVYLPRADFGAALEPKGQILHGAGQDVRRFADSAKCFDAAHRPLVYMTYIGLCNPLADVKTWGDRVQTEMA